MDGRRLGQAQLEYAIGAAIVAALILPVVTLAAAPISNLFAAASSAVTAVDDQAPNADGARAPIVTSGASPTPAGTTGSTVSGTSARISSPSAMPTTTPTATPAPTPTPEALVAWSFDGPTCAGWTNAAWTGTGCAAASSPQKIDSPTVALAVSGSELEVVAWGGDGQPQNLELKLRDYANNTTALSLAPLASGGGQIDVVVPLAAGTTDFGLEALGPGEIDGVRVRMGQRVAASTGLDYAPPDWGRTIG